MDKKLKEIENLANGIESNVYTSCVINIFPQDADNLRWAVETIPKQQTLIESQARVLEGFISDIEDLRLRLIEVRDNVKTANDTVSLEERDEALYEANDSLNYIIDFLLEDFEKELNQ
ncbi:hypothetical protein BKM15_25865 [Pseudomonas syringae pv. syringae]|nr:hypothetical protein BKM15_25865 [Pseudomonas syringae pv. syringae]